MPTIKDVADLAQVSVATVSRVINSDNKVKAQTVEKVNKAMEQLRYRPNMLGRNLRKLETRRILVILETMSNPFYSKVVKGIEDKAREENYVVMICTTRGKSENMIEHLKLIENKVVDGAIIMSTELEREKTASVSRHAHVVCACEPNSIESIPSVSIDDFKSAYDATNFLIQKGHKNIIALSGAFDLRGEKSSFHKREQGFKQALLDNEIEFSSDMIIGQGVSFKDARKAVSKIVKRDVLPSAIFAFSDSIAMGAIKQLSEEGISVPNDISVMGFDNTSMSEVFIPSITTVSQPQYDIGYKAMDILISKIKGEEVEQKNIFPHDIITRQSVK